MQKQAPRSFLTTLKELNYTSAIKRHDRLFLSHEYQFEFIHGVHARYTQHGISKKGPKWLGTNEIPANSYYFLNSFKMSFKPLGSRRRLFVHVFGYVGLWKVCDHKAGLNSTQIVF